MLLNTDITKAYLFREKLMLLWKQSDRGKAEEYLGGLLTELRLSGVKTLIGYAKTLEKHREGIINYVDYPIDTGKLEGTNNKVKVTKRMAYGFSDVEYFKLKIKQQSRATFS